MKLQTRHRNRSHINESRSILTKITLSSSQWKKITLGYVSAPQGDVLICHDSPSFGGETGRDAGSAGLSGPREAPCLARVSSSSRRGWCRRPPPGSGSDTRGVLSARVPRGRESSRETPAVCFRTDPVLGAAASGTAGAAAGPPARHTRRGGAKHPVGQAGRARPPLNCVFAASRLYSGSLG